MQTIYFPTHGYSPVIDYLKGMSILFVVCSHAMEIIHVETCLDPLWRGQAVTIFLLIQVLHSYKHGLDNHWAHVSWTKQWNRVFRPFLFVTALLFIIRLVPVIIHNRDLSGYIIDVIKKGGIGPGSYYPWIHLQFVILIPFFAWILKHLRGGVKLFIAMMLLSESTEIFCSLIDMPLWLYRLLAFRYIFLIYLGYLWASRGIEINKLTISASLLSVAINLIIRNSKPNLEPFAFNSFWDIQHWFCYFYATWILAFLIKKSYDFFLRKSTCLAKLFLSMGRFSYEIFLLQMMVFTIFRF